MQNFVVSDQVDRSYRTEIDSFRTQINNSMIYYSYSTIRPTLIVTDEPIPEKNIHPLTPIMVVNHPLSASSIYYNPWHPLCSIYMPNSLSPQSLKVFFGLPHGLVISSISSKSNSICMFHICQI